jgi:hypothetical protein
METVGGVIWLCGGIGASGGGDVGGVMLDCGWSKSEDSAWEDGVLDLDDGGRDETVLDGEPVEGVNDAGRSVVDAGATNRPSGFLGRSLILLWFLRAAGTDGCGY